MPARLRPFLDNKTELRTPLGPDLRSAQKMLHTAVADLQYRIRSAELAAADAGRPASPSATYGLSVEQIAIRNYRMRIAFDDELRAASETYATVSVDDKLAADLKRGSSGSASNAELQELVGSRIEFFRARGNTAASLGTAEWRKLAIALCASEYEALARVAERDEGDFAGVPSHPTLTAAEPVVPDLPPVSLLGLFDDYIASRKLLSKGDESGRRWKPVFEDLRKFLKHDDARRLTKKDVLAWRDRALKTRSPRTVRDVWLAALRAVLNWAVREDRLDENVAADVRQDVGKKLHTRERGYTHEEALRIIEASLSYRRSDKESEKTAAAKRWVPLLAAFTGARVTELTQLRKQDIMERNGRLVLRITPDAGSVKTGQFRDVPLHRQIVDLGFGEFVEASASGPLFFDGQTAKSPLDGARVVSGRLSEWLGRLEIVPDGVAPNHGWRHRFKTIGRELGYSDRVVDAICGHAGWTAGDNYGDVSLEAKLRVIDAMSSFAIDLPPEAARDQV